MSVILAVCLLTAASEVAILVATTPFPEPLSAGVAFLAFLVGAPAFLAFVTWRRRDKPERIRFLFVIALIVAFLGGSLFSFRALAEEDVAKHPLLNPALVPFVQWFVTLIAWFRVNAADARERYRR